MSSCNCMGPPGDCPCARAARLHMPFDAPIRMRELERERDSERWREFLKSAEFKAIVLDAFKKARARKERQ